MSMRNVLESEQIFTEDMIIISEVTKKLYLLFPVTMWFNRCSKILPSKLKWED